MAIITYSLKYTSLKSEAEKKNMIHEENLNSDIEKVINSGYGWILGKKSDKESCYYNKNGDFIDIKRAIYDFEDPSFYFINLEIKSTSLSDLEVLAKRFSLKFERQRVYIDQPF